MGKVVSDEYLSNLLAGLVFELKYEEEKKMKAELPRRIKQVFRELSTLSFQKQVYLLPIMDLRLGGPLTIAGVQIAEIDVPFLQSIASRYGTGFTFPQETLQQAIQTLSSENGTPTFALVEVEANDSSKGAELANQKADNCLNVLRTIADLSEGDPRFELRSEYASRLTLSIRHLDVTRNSLATETALINLVASVPSLTTTQVTSLTVKLAAVDVLIQKPIEDLTDLEGDLLDAIYWFGRGVKQLEPLLKYIMYFIALESLLVPKYQRAKSATLSRHLTGILYANASESKRKEVALAASELAEIRNEIVHMGKRTVSPEDLTQLEHWTQHVILELLKHTKYPTLDQAIEAEFPLAPRNRSPIERILRVIHLTRSR